MFLKQLSPFKTPKAITNNMRHVYGDTFGNRMGKLGKKVFSKRNVTVGLGTVAATGAATYGGNKLYNHIKQKNRKWWEIL